MNAPAGPPLQKVCVLTGSTGYVGGGLKRALEADGWTVRDPFASVPSQRRRRLGEPVPDEFLAGAGLFVHCAYDFRTSGWPDIERVNVQASHRLFDQAETAGAKRVFISSASAFDGCKSLYGRAKLAVEVNVLSRGGMVLRPGLVYSEDAAGGMVAKLVRLIRLSPFLPVVGTGEPCLGLTHLDDLGRIVVKFARHTGPPPARPIQASDGQRYSFGQVLAMLSAREGRQRWLVPLPAAPLFAGLRLASWLRLPLSFREDNLTSLLNQDPRPEFRRDDGLQAAFRPFQPTARP